jgi:dihydrodipicolinate synthase/N-acetylneuraminate lyase
LRSPAERKLDEKHQCALTRYYIDAGAGGLAVGVHTTQFAIRDVGLYRPVLELAAETAASWTRRPLAMVAGLAGSTRQATAEARTARDIGYHAGLLSLAAMKSASEDEIIAHCTAVAAEIPLVGFYLQPAGRRRHPVEPVLAALCLDRQRHRDQDRAVQPLPHARRPARRGGGGWRSTASRSTPAMTITSCWT